jgi:hypothetical protein
MAAPMMGKTSSADSIRQHNASSIHVVLAHRRPWTCMPREYARRNMHIPNVMSKRHGLAIVSRNVFMIVVHAAEPAIRYQRIFRNSARVRAGLADDDFGIRMREHFLEPRRRTERLHLLVSTLDGHRHGIDAAKMNGSEARVVSVGPQVVEIA